MESMVGVAHDRHDEALVGADGDADVVVVLVDEVGAVDLGVDRRNFLQRLHAGLHEEAHEAELHAVLLLEHVLVLLAQRHHRAHVDLVEGREHGGGVLRVLEAARDGLAQPRHAHALFARRRRRAKARAHLRRGGGAARGHRLRWRPACRPWSRGRLAGAGDIRDRRRFSAASARTAGPCIAWSWQRRGGFGGQVPAPAGGLGGGRRSLRLFAFLRRGAAAPRLRRSGRASAPGSTVSPSFATISPSTPAAGAGTSSVTLSVSSSTSGSSPSRLSPGFLNHLPMVASLTDSPRVGTRISVAIFVAIWARGPRALPAMNAGRPVGYSSGSEGLVEERLELREMLRHQARRRRGGGRAAGIARALRPSPACFSTHSR
jgi:hypothetical protein